MTTSKTFRILRSPLKRFRDPLSSQCFSLRGENRITLDIDPVRAPGWDVASQAVFLVIGCNLLVGGVGFEQSPAPAITPQWIVGITSFFVLDHHEPDFRSRSPMHVAWSHLGVVCSKDFLYENSSVGKLPGFPVAFSGARRCVRGMHLVSFRIEHHVCSEGLETIPDIAGFADISSFVN